MTEKKVETDTMSDNGVHSSAAMVNEASLFSKELSELFEETHHATEWNAIEDKMRLLDRLRKEYREEAQNMAVMESAISSELKAVNKMLAAFEATLARDKSLADDERMSQFTEGIERQRRLLMDVAKAIPQKNSLILSLAVGDINVTLPRLADRMRYKQKYELFKLKMTFVAFCFTFLRVLLDYVFHSSIRFPDAIFLVFLAWYYCSVVLREHILRANGSHIRPWWLAHHYLSIAVVAVVLVWPEGETYRKFYPRFNIFACFVGFIQLLEFDYQRRRMYTLRALGKKDAMDLPSEGVQEVQWNQGLSLLVPFLVVCQIWILYMAYYLFKLSRTPECVEWQVMALGGLFAVIGVGNTYTNYVTLMSKLSRSTATAEASAT